MIKVNLLLTGFEPFGNWAVNPTEVAVNQLAGTSIIINNINFNIIGKIIPLKFNYIRDELSSSVEKYHPSAILLSGQAGGNKIRLEQIAHNNVKTRIPYNCGTTIEDNQSIIDGSPESIETNLPIKLILQQLENNKIPVELSQSAGTFGCNQIFYYSRFDYSEIPSGFIHVPLLKEQAKPVQPYMSQDTITKALKICLSVISQWLSTRGQL